MGGQKCIASLYDFLQKEINLICVSTINNDSSIVPYKVYNILSNSIWRYINLLYFFRLRNIIKKENISHLQIEHPYYGWLGVLLQWFCGVKLIVHSHNIEGLRFKSLDKWWWRVLLSYEKWVHKQADYNLFITEEDRSYALQHFKLNSARCTIVTYGISWQQAPSAAERAAAKSIITNKLGLATDTKIMLFNGTFSYQPNLDGLGFILDKVNPILKEKHNQQYHIVICGKDIPASIQSSCYPNVSIEGFVDDINLYFRAADIFLNPVAEGGGIKTKLVEALANDLIAVSFKNGAIGIPGSTSANKLIITEEFDEEGFANALLHIDMHPQAIGAKYFEHFYLGAIVQRMLQFISK
jgi:glycosyltransferase involved in cell wall biosynthesis